MLRRIRLFPMYGLFVMLIIALIATISIPSAEAVRTSTISYSASGRQMVYINNPELLLNTDLANNRNRTGGRGPSLLTVSLGSGQYRDYFEHLNKTGTQVAYGFYAWNPTSATVTVIRRAKGWADGNFRIGAQPFAQLFNRSEFTRLTLTPNTGGWIFRSDLSYGSGGIAQDGEFLTGVVDFDISVSGDTSAQIIVHHLVYDPGQFNALPGSYEYIGYETRMRPSGSPESRTYKGISTSSEVTANMSFTIGSNDRPQNLQVSYPRYVANSNGTYVPGPTVTSSRWYTHDIPARDRTDSQVVANDMRAFNMPEWGIVNPFTRSSAPIPGDTQNSYPDLGNWGVVYNHNIAIDNTSGRTRSIDAKLGIYNTTDSDNAFVAYQINNGVWQTGEIVESAGQSMITLGRINAAPGPSTHTVRMVLGAPADGRLFHALTLVN